MGFLAGAVVGLAYVLADLAQSALGGAHRPRWALRSKGQGRTWLGGLFGWLAFLYSLRMAGRVQVQSLRTTVLALGAAGGIAIALVGAAFLETRSRVVQRTPRRSSLARGIRLALMVTLPLTIGTVVLAAHYGAELGSSRRILVLVVFLAFERTLFLFARSGPFLRPVREAGVVVLPCCVALAQVPLASAEASRLASGIALPDSVELLRRMTDFDRDGFSALFGGRDCAQFDGTRFPGAREQPGNGVDEDCDGADAAYRISPTAALPTFSHHQRPDGPPLSVLWYVVDSLRRDHLKPYGYAFDTSPTLTGLANESWLFDDALSQSSTTALSMPSMLSGRNPNAMTWRQGVLPVAVPNGPTLAEIFARRGYVTGLALNSWVHDNLPSIQFGFEKVLVSPPEVDWRSGDYLLSNVFEFLEKAKAGAKPFFVVAHVDDVHHPYLASDGKAVAAFPSQGERARYDSGIAVFDQSLRATIVHLRRLGLWDRTVLIITADHGEEFEEHGGTVHSRTCYAESIRVPLLVRLPGTTGQRIRSPVALVDLAPTLLEVLGPHDTVPPLDGQSLFIPAYEPAAVATDRSIFCAVCQVLSGRPSFYRRSVRRASWSLMEDVETGRVELYDRNIDPGERTDLAGRADLLPNVNELRRLLSASDESNLLRLTHGLL